MQYISFQAKKRAKRDKQNKRAQRPVSVNIPHSSGDTSGGEGSPVENRRRHEKSTKGVELNEVSNSLVRIFNF
jgi:hypothetical protein